MKKFISLGICAALAATSIPMTAFAAADIKVSRRPTVENDNTFGLENSTTGIYQHEGKYSDSAPYMLFELDTTTSTNESFKVRLKNGEWAYDYEYTKGANTNNSAQYPDNIDKNGKDANSLDLKDETLKGADLGINKITKLSDSTILVEVEEGNDDKIYLPLAVKGKGNGTIEAEVYDGSSVLGGVYNIGYVGETATTVTVEDTVNFSNKSTLKNILIEEVAPGSLKGGEEITVSISGNFKFVNHENITLDAVSGDSGVNATGLKAIPKVVEGKNVYSNTELTFKLPEGFKTENTLAILKLANIAVQEDDAVSGDVVDLTIRGAGISRTTLEVGKYVDFGVEISAEDKELPQFNAGQVSNEDQTESLKVTMKEEVSNSWWAGRKTTITLPEGVKFKSVEIKNVDNKVLDSTTNEPMISGSKEYNVGESEAWLDFTADKITLSGLKVKTDANGKEEKANLEFKFQFSVEPGFSGDIPVTFGGAALDSDMSVTVAKAVTPISVTAESNIVSIDYRNVEVSDIIIKENYAGALKTDKQLVIGIEGDLIGFESGVEYEVTEGDMKIEKVEKKGSNIVLTIKSASGKTPSTIKISGLKLYLDRSLPQGDYALQVKANKEETTTTASKSDIKDTIFRNYIETEKDEEALFNTDSYDVMSNYITVATQGRDKDDSTFATKVVVTINSTTMTVDGKERTIPVAPYIKEGRTMVPVRAITEALASSSNAEPVQWVDSAKTVIIKYGSRIVTMKIGEAMMNVSGTPIPMNVAPEIVNDYTFIPLRDLGTALGLTDSQIVWDEASQTVTFN